MTTKAQPVEIINGKRKSIWTGYQIVLVIIVLFASALCLLPFINVIAVSFSSKSAILRGDVGFWPVDFTTMAYEAIFSDKSMMHSLWYTVLITVLYTALAMVLTILMAYPLTKKRLKSCACFTKSSVFRPISTASKSSRWQTGKLCCFCSVFCKIILENTAL